MPGLRESKTARNSKSAWRDNIGMLILAFIVPHNLIFAKHPDGNCHRKTAEPWGPEAGPSCRSLL